jgi:hypothetical protein
MIRERRKAHLVAWLWLAPVLAIIMAVSSMSAPPRPAEPPQDAPGADVR